MRRDRRSPEEIKRIREQTKVVKEKSRRKAGIKKVKRGRNWIYVVAGLFAVSGVVNYMQTEIVEMIFFFGIFTATYIMLGIYFYKNPFVISIVALSIYLLILIGDAVYDPSTIGKGIILKIFIISSLAGAISNAKKYKDEFKENSADEDDLLDAELMK